MIQSQHIARSRPLRLALFFLTAALSLVGRPAWSQTESTYFTTENLLRTFFEKSERVSFIRISTSKHREEFQRHLGYVPIKKQYVVFVAKTGTNIDGFAVIDEEMGQHLPITFGVKISLELELLDLEVMVYREGYGDEIRERRFRNQFKMKTTKNSMRVGQDIIAISGATISSNSISVGARRALLLAKLAHDQHQATTSSVAGR